jgi:hypothetical protein
MPADGNGAGKARRTGPDVPTSGMIAVTNVFACRFDAAQPIRNNPMRPPLTFEVDTTFSAMAYSAFAIVPIAIRLAFRATQILTDWIFATIAKNVDDQG